MRPPAKKVKQIFPPHPHHLCNYLLYKTDDTLYTDNTGTVQEKHVCMKYIFLNLKRFDIASEYGGVNSISAPAQWGAHIAHELTARLSGIAHSAALHEYQFPVFLPEAHLIPAVSALAESEGCIRPHIGCQGVYHADTTKGGNFGAFTTLRTANAMRQLGCTWTIIGHSEERRAKAEYMALAGAEPEHIRAAVNTLLMQEVRCARKAGLSVLFCIGETAEEVPRRAEVLSEQLAALDADAGDAGTTETVIGYEPIWAIGPGKTPPSAQEIAQTARIVKTLCAYPLVYGGGLKKENARAIGAVPELDGGLIALTRFSGDIGFYPQEYSEIIQEYMKGAAV